MRFNRSPPLLLNTQSKVCEKKPFEIIMKWLRLVLGVRGGEGEYLGVEWRGRGLAGGVKFKYLPDDEVLFYNSFVLPS